MNQFLLEEGDFLLQRRMKKSTFVVASRRTLNPKEEEEAVDEDVGDGVGDAGVDELVVVVSYYRRVGGDEGGVRRRR